MTKSQRSTWMLRASMFANYYKPLAQKMYEGKSFYELQPHDYTCLQSAAEAFRYKQPQSEAELGRERLRSFYYKIASYLYRLPF